MISNMIAEESTLDVVKAILSLRKSRLRREILQFLAITSPKPCYISEIARKIGVSPTAVIGALRGIEGRYDPEKSLVKLRLVEEVEGSGLSSVRLYHLTKFGCKIANGFSIAKARQEASYIVRYSNLREEFS